MTAHCYKNNLSEQNLLDAIEKVRIYIYLIDHR